MGEGRERRRNRGRVEKEGGREEGKEGKGRKEKKGKGEERKEERGMRKGQPGRAKPSPNISSQV